MPMKQKWANRVFAFVTSVFILTLTLTGCKKTDPNLLTAEEVGDYPVTVSGTEIAVQPKKVLVISPGLADVVLALGSERSLAAASVSCQQSELEVLPKITVSDTQGVIETGADLILSEPLDDETKSSLINAAIPIVELDLAATREEFSNMYAQVGTVLMGDGLGYEAGVETAKNIFIDMDTISRTTKDFLNDTIATTCYLNDLEGRAVTGDMLASRILEYAGMTNVFLRDIDGTYEMDTLILSKPDVIFCEEGLRDAVLSDSRLAELKAIKEERVYEVPYSRMLQYGKIQRITSEIAGLAFPELMQSKNPEVSDPTSEIDSAVEGSVAGEASAIGTESSSAPPPQSVADPAASPSPAPSGAASPAPTETSGEPPTYEAVEYGESGDAVLAMQKRLFELGYLYEDYDGEYGDRTQQAVADFQRENGMEETGDADEETVARIFANNAVGNPR